MHALCRPELAYPARALLLFLLVQIASPDEMWAQGARAQQPPNASQQGANGEQQSAKIDVFRSQRGKLFITDSRRILKLPDLGIGLEIKTIAVWEFGKESQRVNGVEFVLHGQQSRVVRVDLNDVPQISKACSYLKELADKLKDREEASADYVHRSGLSIGVAPIGRGPLQAVLSFDGVLVPLPVESLSVIGQALDSAAKVLVAQ